MEQLFEKRAMSLAEIEAGARLYARERESLSALVRELTEEIESAKRRKLGALRRAVSVAAEAEAELRELVEMAPELFVKPRTVIFHGVKVGFEKGKGRLEFDDAEQVVRLIRKHLPEQAEVLVAVKESPNKKALSALSVADLKRVGCRVEETGDLVVVRGVDTEIDKAVDALLKNAVEERMEE
jgi:hypothetical protein